MFVGLRDGREPGLGIPQASDRPVQLPPGVGITMTMPSLALLIELSPMKAEIEGFSIRTFLCGGFCLFRVFRKSIHWQTADLTIFPGTEMIWIISMTFSEDLFVYSISFVLWCPV